MWITAALVCAALAHLVAPGEAQAWGPGVHLTLGNALLAIPEALPQATAVLVNEHSSAFLYGAISADIFIGKGSRIKPGHSHNWDTGFDLLERAGKDGDPRLAAYAQGYLTHLAADTVAHNCYVPNLLGLTPLGGRLAHVYVEAQADKFIGYSGRMSQDVIPLPLSAADRCLLATTGQGTLPFKVKKRLFATSLAVAGGGRFRRSLRLAEQAMPRASLNQPYLSSMLELALEAVIDVLHKGGNSPVTSVDPIGARRLARAPKFRRRQRTLVQHKRFKPVFPLPQGLAGLPSGD